MTNYILPKGELRMWLHSYTKLPIDNMIAAPRGASFILTSDTLRRKAWGTLKLWRERI